MLCSKCGSEVPENTNFCADCGTPVNQTSDFDTQPQNQNQNVSTTADVKVYTKAVVDWVKQLSQKLSISVKLLGVCAGMSLVFLYYLINYFGPWNLTFLSFLSFLLAPGLFVVLIITQAKSTNGNLLLIIPFALRAFTSLINLLTSLSYERLDRL